MRFLADESCDFAVVRTLRALGHDVLAVSAVQQRSIDRELMEMANAEDRILPTEDKDFGWLVFIADLKSPGVILIRFPAAGRRQLDAAVLNSMAMHGLELEGSFVVLQPGSIRISRGRD